jgi:hypothetical protein
MILTKYFSRVYAASEQDQGDESAEDIYRFIPERHWTPEQRKIVDDWLQRKKEENLAAQRRQQEEDLRPITLDSEVRALWGSGKGFGSPRMSWDTAYVINYLDGVRTVGQLIKTTYERIKKAAWDQVAQSFGYTKSVYNPLPPAGWEEMSNTEKRVAIHNRSLSMTRSVVYDFHGCLKREYRHLYDYTTHPLAPLPQPVINWINYLWDEEQHDDEMKQKDERDEAALKEQDERWAQKAKKMEADAQLIGAALWKARKRLPYWEDATKEEAVEMARKFLTAEPYERGQFSAAIRDIIDKTLKRRIPTKFYYMEPDEAAQFVQVALNTDLKSANPEQVVEVFNKAIGITNDQIPDHPTWSEDVHPGLGGNTLGQAGMLKAEAAAEIRRRLQMAQKSDDDATIHKIYYALDAENRRFFFKK